MKKSGQRKYERRRKKNETTRWNLSLKSRHCFEGDLTVLNSSLTLQERDQSWEGSSYAENEAKGKLLGAWGLYMMITVAPASTEASYGSGTRLSSLSHGFISSSQ